MLGHELAVEQFHSGMAHPRDQEGERRLGCIPRPGNHALAKEGPPQRKTVESPDQFTIAPAFDAVGKTQPVQAAERLFDLAVDPGGRPVRRALRAQGDDLVERTVYGEGKAFLSQGARQ